MARVIIKYSDESVVKEVRNHGKVVCVSDLINIIGADVPENKLEEIRKIGGVEKVYFPGKADALV